ncbi:alpha/beta hydrolase family protein [Prevotella sp.]|uniref:alpha/beta hydrolase family protein n=1 Tax=Prevotella sp. TaxID=59823 RepID=UPI002649C76E|nr:alpha/beta fold hydrolase [Prevotella sp.]MDN5553118.1 alpha/beta hydrolase [Prevotella sp.]
MKKLLSVIAIMLFVTTSYAQNRIDGVWTGKLNAGAQTLTIIIHVNHDANGNATSSLDSPDQGASNIPAKVDYCSSDSVAISIANLGASFKGRLNGDEIIGGFSQMGYNFPLNLKRGEEKLNRPQNPAKPYPYKTEDVTFTNATDKAILAGTICYPTNYQKGKTPVMLMVTGSGLENRDEEVFDHKPFLVIADYLARNGIATLRYDDRSFGESKGGDVKNATTKDFARDAEAGIAYLKSTKKFGKVGVLGHSEGGSIAFMLGAKDKVDFIISMAGIGVKGDTALTAQTNKAMELAGQTKRLTTLQFRISTTFQKSPWLNYFIDYDPAADIAATRCPVMAIDGDKDFQVISSLNLAGIKKNLHESRYNFIREYPSLNHLFQHCTTGAISEYRAIEETISPEVLSDMVKWINSLK